MRNEQNIQYPSNYLQIEQATKQSGFNMASDVLTGCLLRTLASSKPAANFLELGTGTGLSTAWILDGMDVRSSLLSVDNNPVFLEICHTFLGSDTRLRLECMDGEEWIMHHLTQKFDFIFADTWPGKYFLLDEVLTMLNPGGIYLIDDMLPQPNWPDGHEDKARNLVTALEHRTDLVLTKQSWSTGILICVKK